MGYPMPRQKRWSSVLHGVRDMRFGEVADSDEGWAASQDGTKNIVGVAGEEMLERFAGAAVGLEGVEKAGDGVGNFIGAAPDFVCSFSAETSTVRFPVAVSYSTMSSPFATVAEGSTVVYAEPWLSQRAGPKCFESNSCLLKIVARVSESCCA